MFVFVDSARMLTHHNDSSTSAPSRLKTIAHPINQQIRITMKTLDFLSCLTDFLANSPFSPNVVQQILPNHSLSNMCGGQQRSLRCDFQKIDRLRYVGTLVFLGRDH